MTAKKTICCKAMTHKRARPQTDRKRDSKKEQKHKEKHATQHTRRQTRQKRGRERQRRREQTPQNPRRAITQRSSTHYSINSDKFVAKLGLRMARGPKQTAREREQTDRTPTLHNTFQKPLSVTATMPCRTQADASVCDQWGRLQANSRRSPGPIAS